MAAKSARLRPVSEGDKPAKVLSLTEAVATGDYRSILVAQRAEIAAAIPEERGPAKAALHRQLSLIAKELAEMDEERRGRGGGRATAGDEAWDASAI